MGRQPSKLEREIHDAIVDYAENNDVENLSAIADYVESQLGHRPAKDTIADVLRELGYVSSSRYWVKA
jgi:transposase